MTTHNDKGQRTRTSATSNVSADPLVGSNMETVMGIREYLEKLDLDQLRYARDTAEEMIAEKEAEQKLVVWCLEDRDMILETFSDADYVKAAERLLETARENAASPTGNMKPRDKILQLRPKIVPASEYGEWVSVLANAGNKPTARSDGRP